MACSRRLASVERPVSCVPPPLAAQIGLSGMLSLTVTNSQCRAGNCTDAAALAGYIRSSLDNAPVGKIGNARFVSSGGKYAKVEVSSEQFS